MLASQLTLFPSERKRSDSSGADISCRGEQWRGFAAVRTGKIRAQNPSDGLHNVEIGAGVTVSGDDERRMWLAEWEAHPARRCWSPFRTHDDRLKTARCQETARGVVSVSARTCRVSTKAGAHITNLAGIRVSPDP